MTDLCPGAPRRVSHNFVSLQYGVRLSPPSSASFPSRMPKNPLGLLTPSYHLLLERRQLTQEDKPGLKGRGVRPHHSPREGTKPCSCLTPAIVNSINAEGIHGEQSSYSRVYSSVDDHKVDTPMYLPSQQSNRTLPAPQMLCWYPPSPSPPTFPPKDNRYSDFY